MESLRHCGTLLACQHWVGWEDDTRVEKTNIRWGLGGGGGGGGEDDTRSLIINFHPS